MSDAESTEILDRLARKLAVAMSDERLREMVSTEVGKRFDGDTNALWRTLSEQYPRFSTRVAGSERGGESVAADASKLPLLQIAVPENFDSWDPSAYSPVVAYLPQGVDDTSLTQIPAYDTEGMRITLDAQEPPSVPVIVLGLNERTDGNGQTQESPNAQSPSSRERLARRASSYAVGMVIVELKDDREPWAKGDAEIALRAKSRGCSDLTYSEGNWSNLENTGDVWAPGSALNLGSTSCDVVFYWWEDDGGAFDFTLTYDGFGLGVAMDDDDDLIGGKQLPHASFEGSSMQETVWSSIEMWTQ